MSSGEYEGVPIRRLPEGPVTSRQQHIYVKHVKVARSSIRQKMMEGNPVESSQAQTLAWLQKLDSPKRNRHQKRRAMRRK